MRFSKNLVTSLSVLIFIFGSFAFTAIAYTPGVSHPASEIIGDPNSITQDATFGASSNSLFYKFPDYLEAGGQITAGTKFYVGGAELTSTGVGQTGYTSFSIKTADSDRLIIADNGNIGIGTPLVDGGDPGGPMPWLVEIVRTPGQGYGHDYPTVLGLRSNSTSTGAETSLRFTNSSWPNPSHHRVEITAVRTNDPTTGAHDLFFELSDGSSMAERVRITSAGYVGIGTAAPSYQLTLADIYDEQAGFIMSPSDPPGLSGSLALYNSGLPPAIPDMVIDPLGNVGINKVDPQTVLDVEGTVTAVSFVGDGSALTGIGTGTGGVINTGSTTIGADSDNDGTGQIDFQSGGTTRMMLKNDGRIGIVPDITRPFNDPTRTLCLGSQTTCISNGIDTSIGSPSPTWDPTELDLDTLAFFTSNSERMRITDGGDIGIGTSSPTTDLHLSDIGSIGLLLDADTDDDGETDQPSITFNQDGEYPAGTTAQIGFFGGSNDFTLEHLGSYALHLGTADTTRMTIQGGGNVVISENLGVGVGPSYKLDVAGDIHASGDIYADGTIYGALVGIASDLDCTPDGCVDATDIANGAVTNVKISAMDWNKLQNYPLGACGAGQAIQELGDVPTCIDVNPTGSITGLGSNNYLARFTGNYTIGTSIIFDDGSAVGIGTATPTSGYIVDVSGNLRVSNAIWAGDQISSGSEFRAGNSFLGLSSGRVAGSLQVDTNLTVSGISASCEDVETDISNNLVCGTDEIGASGSGTTNYIPKWTNGTTLGNSIMSESGSTLSVSGGIVLTDGLRLNPAGAKPTCDSATRGTLWFTEGAASVKDDLEICAKDATDSYAWRNIW